MVNIDGVLTGLWIGSLFFVAVALGLFIVILLRRWLGAYWARRSARLAMELAELLILHMGAGVVPRERLKTLTRHPRRTALAVIELSALVRGRELERVMRALREASAARRIARLLTKPGLDTRLMAIEALGLIGGAGSRRALDRAFMNCPTIRETIAAAHALHKLGSPPDLGALLQSVHAHRRGAPAELANLLQDIARTDPHRLATALDTGAFHPSLQIQLIAALTRAHAVTALAAIKRSTRAADPAVRAASVDAIARLGGPDDAQTLDQAALDRSPQVRAQAGEAIGRLGLTGLAPTLTDLMEDGHWEVRFQAGRALTRLGEPGLARLKEIALAGREGAGHRTAQMILDERQAA